MKLVGLVGVIALAVIGSAAVWTLLSGKQAVARGPVSSSGSGSAYPKSGDRLRFAEEKDWLGEAGLNDAKRYASFARPNIGVSESRLGMSHLEFRNRIERRMYEEVLKEDPKVFLDRIKKEKFGVDSSGQGAQPVAVWTDTSLNPSQKYRAFKNNHPNELKIALAELDRLAKLGGKLNAFLADYILGIAKRVVAERGDPSNKLQVAKAYVVGWYHFLSKGNAIEYESLIRSIGPIPPSGKFGGIIFKEGVLGLDRPRGMCDDFTTSMMAGLRVKATDLGISPFVCGVMSKSAEAPRARHGTNHSLVGVRHSGGSLEFFDPTQRRDLVSADVDGLAKWFVHFNGFAITGGAPNAFTARPEQWLLSQGDPASTLDRQAFDSIPISESARINRAVP